MDARHPPERRRTHNTRKHAGMTNTSLLAARILYFKNSQDIFLINYTITQQPNTSLRPVQKKRYEISGMYKDLHTLQSVMID